MIPSKTVRSAVFATPVFLFVVVACSSFRSDPVAVDDAGADANATDSGPSPVADSGSADGASDALGAPDVVVPDGVPTLDARGRWVLPGFVEAHAHMGVMEEAEGWAGNDTNEMTDPNGAALRAIDAINVEDDGFLPLWRPEKPGQERGQLVAHALDGVERGE